MGLAHLLIGLAWVIAVFAVWLWLLSRPRKHTGKTVLLTACVFVAVFFGLDVLMVRLKVAQERAAAQQKSMPSSESIPKENTLPSPTLLGAPSSSPLTTPGITTMPSAGASQNPATAKQEKSVVPLSGDVKIGVLQCSASESDMGLRIISEAICIAKHQQSGQEFVGTVGEGGTAIINLPQGFYVVTIKAKGYITRVEAVNVGDDIGNVTVVLQKER